MQTREKVPNFVEADGREFEPDAFVDELLVGRLDDREARRAKTRDDHQVQVGNVPFVGHCGVFLLAASSLSSSLRLDGRKKTKDDE